MALHTFHILYVFFIYYVLKYEETFKITYPSSIGTTFAAESSFVDDPATASTSSLASKHCTISGMSISTTVPESGVAIHSTKLQSAGPVFVGVGFAVELVVDLSCYPGFVNH